ncbi:MAG TPA: 4Fe-4S dicluster domain-containing protein [Bacillota bacterium]|nr:4Fe-4S dicluster domain-containing protein [Bacillota bacterium]
MNNLVIPVGEEGRTRALNEVLGKLLELGVVDAMMVPTMVTPGVITYLLARDPEFARSKAEPFAPVMPVNGASFVAKVVSKKPKGKVCALLKPCEVRALTELVKLKQAEADNLLVIGIDCLGTVARGEYEKAYPDVDRLSVREACKVCLNPDPPDTAFAGINIGYIGLDDGRCLLASLSPDLDDRIRGVIEELGFEKGDGLADQRQAALAVLKEERGNSYEEFLRKTHAEQDDGGVCGIAKLLAACVGCRNCRVACPVCYCRECIFDGDVFEYETRQLLERAEKKGGLKIPGETLLYHLTRMNHMSLSCVACGMCEEACPVDIRLFPLFARIARRTQGIMEYTPGRSPEDPLPFTTFREDELEPR